MTTDAELRELEAAARSETWVVLGDNPWQVRLSATDPLCGKVCFEVNCETPADAALIAALRNEAPRLIAASERLEEAVRLLRWIISTGISWGAAEDFLARMKADK